MPQYKTHLAGGIFAFVACILLFSLQAKTPQTLLEWALWCLLGSLFPDIDTKSKGQQVWYPLLFLLAFIMIMHKAWMMVGLLVFLGFTSTVVRHRGMFHNLWFVAAACCVFAFLSHLYSPAYAHLVAYDCVFFFVGVASHVALDLGPRRMWFMRW
jgi:uncharacterized metal-binding protein